MTTEAWGWVDDVVNHLDEVGGALHRWVDGEGLPADPVGCVGGCKRSEGDPRVRAGDTEARDTLDTARSSKRGGRG